MISLKLNLSLFSITSTVINTGFTSIDQVFNGMGYIGSTVWVDKGVKGLIPNGRNEDGSLNNIEIISDKLFIHTCAEGSANWLFMTDLKGGRYRNASIKVHYEQIEKPTPTGNYATWYNAAENKIYFYSSGVWEEPKVLIVCEYSTDSGSITTFRPKLPFRAVDYNDKSEVSGWAMPSDKHIDLTLGASNATYTAPANGYVRFAKLATAANQFIYMSASVPVQIWSSAASQYLQAYLPVRKGYTFTVGYTAAGATAIFGFVPLEGDV